MRYKGGNIFKNIRAIRFCQSRDEIQRISVNSRNIIIFGRPDRFSFCKQNSVSDRQLQFRDSRVLYSQLRFNTIDEGLFKR